MSKQMIPLALALFILGCAAGGPTRNPHPIEIEEPLPIQITDHLGGSYELDRAPPRPVFVTTATDKPAYLFRTWLEVGPLLAALRAPPPLQRYLDYAEPLDVETRAGETLYMTVNPLAPGRAYTFCTQDDAERWHLVRLQTGGDVERTRVASSWPPEGVAVVNPDLPYVIVRFNRSVLGAESGVHLATEDSEVVSERAERVNCTEYGFDDGECYRAEVRGPLLPGVNYSLIAEALLDEFGFPIEDWWTGFSVAEAPLSSAPITCAIDEYAFGFGCALVTDHAALLRVSLTGPARVQVSAAGREFTEFASRGYVELTLGGLPVDSDTSVTMTAQGLGGEPLETSLTLETSPLLPPVRITEVASNPIGPEPASEWVEIVNDGETSVWLGDLMLSDSPHDEGELLPAFALLPSSVALIVPDRYAPEIVDGLPAGTTLIRVGATLGSGGLSNAGEPVYLRTLDARRVSAAPAVAVSEGECLVRSDEDDRLGGPESFITGECSPGRRP